MDEELTKLRNEVVSIIDNNIFVLFSQNCNDGFQLFNFGFCSFLY